MAQEREVTQGNTLVGWVGGPVARGERWLWYARPNPAAGPVRLPERTVWLETEAEAVKTLLDLFSDLSSTAKIKRLPGQRQSSGNDS